MERWGARVGCSIPTVSMMYDDSKMDCGSGIGDNRINFCLLHWLLCNLRHSYVISLALSILVAITFASATGYNLISSASFFATWSLVWVRWRSGCGTAESIRTLASSIPPAPPKPARGRVKKILDADHYKKNKITYHVRTKQRLYIVYSIWSRIGRSVYQGRRNWRLVADSEFRERFEIDIC